MKITDVEGIMLRLPEVRRIGDGCQSILVIKVHTDEGITGTGEAHSNPLINKAVLDAPFVTFSSEGLCSLLLGEDPRDISWLWDKMVRHTQTVGRRGVVMHVISSIDIALWKAAAEQKPAKGMPWGSGEKEANERDEATEDLALIARLLAKPDISKEVQSELLGHQQDIHEGRFTETELKSARKYLRDLDSRLSDRQARAHALEWLFADDPVLARLVLAALAVP